MIYKPGFNHRQYICEDVFRTISMHINLDGHCLLHSVIYGMKNQLSVQRTCDLIEIAELIRHETISNIDLYVSFLLQGTRAILLSQMNMYIYDKMYDTRYGDMLPLVLCNALCLNLIILSQTASGYDIRTVVGRSSNNPCKYLLVHKYEDHYDGITVNAETNNVNIMGHTLVSSTLDIDPCRPTNVASILNSAPGGGTLNCGEIDTTAATRSSDDKSHDASLCDMNASVSDPLNMSVSDGSVVDYISHLKRYRTDNPKNCIIGHLNINSIRNKSEAVKCVLNDGLMDIFALSESKIDESFPNAQFIVNDFSLHRKDRNRFGGGILLYMRSDIPHRRRHDLELNSKVSHGVEIMIIETRLYKMEKWFVVIIYKPPRVTIKSFENVLTEIFQSLEK